jgi:photosystem II stability/assembly factor-like uncharacterized protein
MTMARLRHPRRARGPEASAPPPEPLFAVRSVHVNHAFVGPYESLMTSQQSESVKLDPSRRRRVTPRSLVRPLAFGLAVACALGALWLVLRAQLPRALEEEQATAFERIFGLREENGWMLAEGVHGTMAPLAAGGGQPLIVSLAAARDRAWVALADGTVLSTSGTTGNWDRTRLPVEEGPGSVSLAFVTDLDGYAVGGTRELFKTHDGGRSWQSVESLHDDTDRLIAVTARGSELWALGENQLWFSSDGGKSWVHTPLPKEKRAGRLPWPSPREFLRAQNQKDQEAEYRRNLAASQNIMQRADGGTSQTHQQFEPIPAQKQPESPAGRSDLHVAAPEAPPARVPTKHSPALAQRPLLGPIDRHQSSGIVTPTPPLVPPKGRAWAGPGVAVCTDAPHSAWVLSPRGTFQATASRSGDIKFERGERGIACGGPLLETESGALVQQSRGGSSPETLGRRKGTAVAFWNNAPVIASRATNNIGNSSLEILGSPKTMEISRNSPVTHLAAGDKLLWAVDGDDFVYVLNPSGEVSTVLNLRTTITSAAAIAPSDWVAGTSTGVVLRSRDRGAAWTKIAATNVAIVGIAQTILTSGSSATWIAIPSDWETTRSVIRIDNGAQVKLPEGTPRFLRPNLDGSTSAFAGVSPLASSVPKGTHALLTLANGRQWYAGANGLLGFHARVSQDENAVSLGTSSALRDIAFDGEEGWVVGESGALFHSLDGGLHWRPVPTLESRQALNAVIIDKRVAVFGDGDFIRWSDDDGLTWSAPQARAIPGFGFYALIALAGAFGLVGFAVRSKAPEAPRSGVEDLLASDAPIEAEEQDAIDQAQFARTLAYFLENDRTEAPLTLAITGEWGTGKTSILNLIRARLKRAGMPIVSFNAWHHQQDREPLASLYAAIVDAVMPTGFAGLGFRLRLALKRWTRQKLKALVALLSLLLCASFAYSGHEYTHDVGISLQYSWNCWIGNDPRCEKPNAADGPRDEASEGINQTESSPAPEPASERSQQKKSASSFAKKETGAREKTAVSPTPTTAKKPTDAGPSAERKREVAEQQHAEIDAERRSLEAPDHTRHRKTFWLGLLGWLLVFAPAAVSLLGSLRTFGVDPAALVASVAGSFRINVERKQVSFQANFAKEFEEVTSALGERRLTVMVDDLDRCTPSNLMKVLEAINFLATSGDCFIVLAFSRPVVLDNLARQLRGRIETTDNSNGGDTTGAAKAKGAEQPRHEQAERYLEKLINLEVTVPELEPAQAANMLKRAVPQVPREPRAPRMMQAALWMIALVSMSLGAVRMGQWLGTRAEADLHAAKLQAPLPIDPVGTQPLSPAPARPDSPVEATGKPGLDDTRQAVQAPSMLPAGWELVETDPARPSPWTLSPWFLAALALVAIGLARTPPKPRMTDSPQFTRALEDASEVLRAKHRTPRAMKRFLNVLRFRAMQVRAAANPDAPKSAVVEWFGRNLKKVAERPPGDLALSEDTLVALAVLEDLSPAALHDEVIFKATIDLAKEAAELWKPSLDPNLREALRSAWEPRLAIMQAPPQVGADALAVFLARSAQALQPANRRRYLDLRAAHAVGHQDEGTAPRPAAA